MSNSRFQTRRLRFLPFALAMASVSVCHAVTLFDVDNFSDGLSRGWTNGSGGNGIAVVPNGQSGASDQYLRVDSGFPFFQPKLAMYNDDSRYLGDYIAVGAYAIRVSMTNLTATPLSLRLVLYDLDGGVWTTTNSLTLAASAPWTSYNFSIAAADLTQVSGIEPYTTGLSSVTRVMIRHQEGPPSTRGTSVEGAAGFDNLQVVPAPTQSLTGSLNLSNTGAFALNRTIAYTVKQGTATIGSGSVTASASASAFNISVPGSFSGAATISWDGSSFLLRKTNISLTGSNQAIGSVTMQNGDVDHSGEVDAADIDAVIADFGSVYPGGSTPDADVDVSGEVDAADIDIIIANFGGIDD